MSDPQTRDVERWFMRRGFTALLEGTSMRRRRAARLARTLAVVFVAVMVIEVPRYGSNVGVTLAVSVAVVVLTWVAGNLLRRRPPFALPDRVTGLDRAVFLLFPGLVVLATPHDALRAEDFELSGLGAGVLIAVGMVFGQLVLMGVFTLLAYSGVIALGPWLWRRLVSSFLAGGTAIGRTLPLLLGVVGFLFFTGELWQAVGGLSPFAYLLAVLLFVSLSWLFLHSRGLDLDALAHFEQPGEIAEQVAGTPLAGGEVPTPVVCPLTVEQRKNLRLVGVISKLTIATVVGLAVFVFFVLLGLITVNAEVARAWTQAPPEVLLQWTTEKHSYALTLQHLRVCGFLAVFSGFYFAVVSATDPVLREGLRDGVEDDVRQACAARLVALQRFPEPGPVEPGKKPDAPDVEVIPVAPDAAAAARPAVGLEPARHDAPDAPVIPADAGIARRDRPAQDGDPGSSPG